MATAWQTDGKRMATTCQTHGACKRTNSWHMHGNCMATHMEIAWHRHGIRTASGKQPHGKCMAHA
eukprot:11201536-Lingulodinium_polyedra.AAC.1